MFLMASEYNFLSHAADEPRARIEELKKKILDLRTEMERFHKDYFQSGIGLNGELIKNNERIISYLLSPGPVSPGFPELLDRKL